jgi:hypothetical protein
MVQKNTGIIQGWPSKGSPASGVPVISSFFVLWDTNPTGFPKDKWLAFLLGDPVPASALYMNSFIN